MNSISINIPRKTIILAIVIVLAFTVLLIGSLVLFCICWSRASGHRDVNLRQIVTQEQVEKGKGLSRAMRSHSCNDVESGGGDVELTPLPARPLPVKVASPREQSLSTSDGTSIESSSSSGRSSVKLARLGTMQPVRAMEIAARMSWYGKGRNYERLE